MRSMKKLRIALYTHSTNPRGGVVHSLELGNALAEAGHDVTVHAPDPSARGFFRRTAARQLSIKAAPAPATLSDMVAQRIGEIATHIRADNQRYDIYHAQDSINANALANCTESGDIPGFIRTVHHVDHYTDDKLLAWQSRGIRAAQRCFTVSQVWKEFLSKEYQIDSAIVWNGVSLDRFLPEPALRDVSLRTELRLGDGPVYLAVGGVEARKNTINILHAFRHVLDVHVNAQLVIAGGASLLDHSHYQTLFRSERAALGIGDRVLLTGPVADADMPSLYRIADALVFPSVKEGFGLVVLEALATETPVIVSRIAPFTEYLTDLDCCFADPNDVVSIGAAMVRAISIDGRATARHGRRFVAAAMGWDKSAAIQLALYQPVLNKETVNA
jgi:glycosyltransferase-like protein